jgi:hypothetical protein
MVTNGHITINEVILLDIWMESSCNTMDNKCVRNGDKKYLFCKSFGFERKEVLFLLMS